MPICEDSLPTSNPSSSVHPTITPKPTTSHAPTPEPACESANPQICGCGSVNQADYRGSISTTKNGDVCRGWSDIDVEKYPDDGLEGHNYCRTTYDDTVGAWCRTGAQHSGDFDYCNVPYCFPPSTSCSSSADAVGNMSEELQVACTYHQCVDESGQYDSHDSGIITREEVVNDCACPFELWDCKFGSGSGKKECDDTLKCCSSKLNDSKWTAKEASCECSIKPNCEAGDSAQCNYFAEHCCEEDDQQCHCEYQTRACRLALESDQEEVSAMAHIRFCPRAEDACCDKDNYEIGGCKCEFLYPLCTDFPNEKVDSVRDTCKKTSINCCTDKSEGSHCRCDLFSHAKTLGWEGIAESHCSEASNISPEETMELESLQSIYSEMGGEYWLINSGWDDSSSHCTWHGITCDEEAHVTEINLSSNNVTGEFPSDSLSKLYKLERLDLSDNNVRGTMAGTSENWFCTETIVADTSVFFNLRDLIHVDLSQNNLSGEVDVLFAPAIEYANFSHNNFTSINSFKEFKRSHQTLILCDVSHNSINASGSDIMKHVPTNIEQMILSDNLIHGPLPTSLEHLANLRILSMDSNRLSGELPSSSSSFPNLRALDLSNQKQASNTSGFTGVIPEGLSNLPFLTTLNLGGNKLSGGIPPTLGGLSQLKVLDLSDNELDKFIPKELGALSTMLERIDLSLNKLTGRIPSEFGQFVDASVLLAGNTNL